MPVRCSKFSVPSTPGYEKVHIGPTAVRHSRVTAKTSSTLLRSFAVEYKPLASLKLGPQNRRSRIELDLAFVDTPIWRWQVFVIKTPVHKTAERSFTELDSEVEHER
jgi:hypothetical protein